MSSEETNRPAPKRHKKRRDKGERRGKGKRQSEAMTASKSGLPKEYLPVLANKNRVNKKERI